MKIQHLLGGLAVAGLLLAGQAQAKPKATINDAIIDALMDQADKQMDANDYKGAAQSFQSVIANPVFASTSPAKHFQAYFGLGIAEFQNDQKDDAYAALKQAEAFATDDDAGFWYTVAIIAHADHQYDAAAVALTKYAVAAPDKLNDMDDDEVELIAGDAAKDGGTHKQALLEALWAAKYHPANPFWTAEWLWSDLFETYATQGNDDKAKAILPALVSPGSLLDIRVDNRFARFVAADPDRFDYGKAQAAELASDRSLADAHPDLIAGAQNLAQHLSNAGQLDEALKVTDDAIAKAKADPKAYSDTDDYLRWVRNTRADVLSRLGRWDEAATEMTAAQDLATDDKASQTINLADLDYQMGKPQAALDAVKDIDDGNASPYGVLSADEARACAYAALKDTAHLNATLDYVRAHIGDGWGPARAALECAGDSDGLARDLIARLDDPDTRVDALTSVQTYLPLPHPSAAQSQMAAVWAGVLARDDVKAAIAKYGVVIQLPAFPPNY